MTPADFDFLRKFLKDRSGLDLSAEKRYLVESRLLPLARRLELPGIPELVQKVRSGAEPLVSDVVEAMTTNETFFFRDKLPFDHLREEILPTCCRRVHPGAACGSGAPPARPDRSPIRSLWC